MDKRTLEQTIEPIDATMDQIVKSFFAKDPKPKKPLKKRRVKPRLPRLASIVCYSPFSLLYFGDKSTWNIKITKAFISPVYKFPLKTDFD